MVKTVEKGSDPLVTPVVYVVSDRRRLAPAARTTADEVKALEAWLAALVDARPDVIQIRERDLPPRELAALVRRAVTLAGRAVRILVNDRADVAVAAGAHGVHLRADGPPVARVRALGPPGWTIGRSTHSPQEIAPARDADYVLFGHVFDTASKPGAVAAGLDALRDAVRASPVPVIAIGGIDVTTAASCAAAGAAGVAAIGLFATGSGRGARERLIGTVRDLRAAMSAGRC
jgi:thiamine-phosphate diphosphorylase